MDRMQKNAGFTVGLAVFYCGFHRQEQGWFMIIWVKYRTTVTIHVGHYPKMTQHFRLVKCLKKYPCTMGKSSFEDLFGKVIKEFRPKILWGFELTIDHCELRQVAAASMGRRCPKMDQIGVSWVRGSFCRHMDELATLIECCRRDTSHDHRFFHINFETSNSTVNSTRIW